MNSKEVDSMNGAPKFHWFMGVVEDIIDPEQLGRVRVRCFGYHTEKIEFIPTYKLPWAQVMMPVTSASQCGVGESPTGLECGSWVIGFFRDGESAQDPVIMGSTPAITSPVDYRFGFSDYNNKDFPYRDKVNQPDIPDEAIDKDDKYKQSFSYEKKKSLRIGGEAEILFDFGKPLYDVLELEFLEDEGFLPDLDGFIKPKYPRNNVKAYRRKLTTPVELKDPYKTPPKGQITPMQPVPRNYGKDPEKQMIVFEVDTTEDFERISTIHPKGTYEEWNKDGDIHLYIERDNYKVVKRDNISYTKRDDFKTVDGNQTNLIKKIKSDTIKLDSYEVVGRSRYLTVINDDYESYKQSQNIKVYNELNETVYCDVNEEYARDHNMNIGFFDAGSQSDLPYPCEEPEDGGSQYVNINNGQTTVMGGDHLKLVGGKSEFIATEESVIHGFDLYLNSVPGSVEDECITGIDVDSGSETYISGYAFKNDVVPRLLPCPAESGDMIYYNGSAWISLPAPVVDEGEFHPVLRHNGTVPYWDFPVECD